MDKIPYTFSSCGQNPQLHKSPTDKRQNPPINPVPILYYIVHILNLEPIISLVLDTKGFCLKGISTYKGILSIFLESIPWDFVCML